MFVRRMRTLMDKFLISAVSTTGPWETRLAELRDLMDPPGAAYQTDADQDLQKWGYWTDGNGGQQFGGTLYIALAKQLAYPRRRDPSVCLETDIVDESDVEVGAPAQLAQGLDGAAALGSETEVAAHEDNPSVQRLHQDLGDETLGGEICEGAIEADHKSRVDSRRGEQLELSFGAHEGFGRVSRGEYRQGVSVERHHNARKPVCRGHPQKLRDNRPVPRVHAVELAYRDRGAAERGGNLGRVGEDLHDSSEAGRVARSQIIPSTGSTRGMKT
jgi:hypothetical protein